MLSSFSSRTGYATHGYTCGVTLPPKKQSIYTVIVLVLSWRVSQPLPLLLQEWASMQGGARLTGLAVAIALVCTVARATNGWVGVALTLAPPGATDCNGQLHNSSAET